MLGSSAFVRLRGSRPLGAGAVYHNLWVLRFTDDGRCRSFTEWYMEAPAANLSSA